LLPEAEFLNEIQTKVLRVFHIAIHSHLYSFALRFLFLQIHPTSYSFYIVLLYTVKHKEGKPDGKPHPLPYGFRKPYRNLKSENSLDNAQKPQKKLYVHGFGFRSSPLDLMQSFISFPFLMPNIRISIEGIPLAHPARSFNF
jgi:hypothetical protein